MSVMVRGIEMPDKCGHCRFATTFECQVTKNFITTFNVRQADCPLIPIPSHGRLIDADILKDVQQADADFFKGSSNYGEKCRYDEAINAVANIVNAPTIIEAEDGDKLC